MSDKTPPPDAAEGEERLDDLREVIERACRATYKGDNPEAIAAYIWSHVGPRLDEALARATAAEDRADASETRERVTHERAEQAESQLAHYKAEVERLLLAVEEAWRYLDDSRLSAEAASEAAHGVLDSALTPPSAEEDESA